MTWPNNQVYWLMGAAALVGVVFGLLTPPGHHTEGPELTPVWLASMLGLGLWHAFEIRQTPESAGFFIQAIRGTALAMVVSRISHVPGLLLKMTVAGQFY